MGHSPPRIASRFRALDLGSAVKAAWDAFHNGRRVHRRASLLIDLGDEVALVQPPRWQLRSRRAYEAAIRRLGKEPRIEPPSPSTAASDPTFVDAAAVAHTLLREARRPYRQLAIVLGRSCALALAVLA